MREGWLIDRDGFWICRFHRDEKSWVRDQKVFVDQGKQLPDSQPPLLKTRRHLRREEAEVMWKQLVRMGCKRTEPLCGRYADV